MVSHRARRHSALAGSVARAVFSLAATRVLGAAERAPGLSGHSGRRPLDEGREGCDRILRVARQLRPATSERAAGWSADVLRSPQSARPPGEDAAPAATGAAPELHVALL